MSYQHPIHRSASAKPARPVVVAIDGGAYVPRPEPGLSPRRRIAIILGASAVLWSMIVLLILALIR